MQTNKYIKGNHYISSVYKTGQKSSLVKGLKIELWALSCRGSYVAVWRNVLLKLV